MIERLCIVGVGLIGGSLARALREKDYCQHVVGSSRNAAHLQRAIELGVIDSYSTDLTVAAEGADMTVVCTPLRAMPPVFETLKSVIAPDGVISDAGSAKSRVIESVREVFGTMPANFVPAHPIAGTEHSGVEASFSTLYEGRRVVITPEKETDPQASLTVRRMWEATGAIVESMDAKRHDAVLAATSHLPHVLAYSLVEMLAGERDAHDVFRFAAGGFRDFTRIASSDPQMWHDICLDNDEAILVMLDRYRAQLDGLRDDIVARRSEALFKRFEDAKFARDKYVVALDDDQQG